MLCLFTKHAANIQKFWQTRKCFWEKLHFVTGRGWGAIGEVLRKDGLGEEIQRVAMGYVTCLVGRVNVVREFWAAAERIHGAR